MSSLFIFVTYLDILKYDLRLRFLALKGKINQKVLSSGRFFVSLKFLYNLRLAA